MRIKRHENRKEINLRKMRLLTCCRLQVLSLAVAVSMMIGFAIQMLGISIQKRPQLVNLDQPQELPHVFHTQGHIKEPQCYPKLHIMFLKTHKTASSTILNILYRFGEAHHLTFALPLHYQFGYPNIFRARRVKNFRADRKMEYHILCNHMRFFLPEIKKVMPRDTFFFSILRNPVTMAESSYAYYKSVSSAFKKVRSFEQFLDDPWKYYSIQEPSNHYARNLLWFDFGFNHNTNYTETYAESVITNIENTFHLILLAEYFDESMVLLQDALCWDLDDVVAFRLNFRSKESVRQLSSYYTEKLKAWNSLDWHLYTHFNRTFWRKVEQYGHDRMQRAVSLLKQKRQDLMELCLIEGRPVEAARIQDKSIKPLQFGQARILGYNIKPEVTGSLREKCLRMVIPELQHKDLIDVKQFPATSLPTVRQ